MKICGSPLSPILDPTVSPDGSMIAYVREEELFVASLRCGEPKQITFGAREAGKVNFNIKLRITENYQLLSCIFHFQHTSESVPECAVKIDAILHLIDYKTVCADSWTTGVHFAGNLYYEEVSNVSMSSKLQNLMQRDVDFCEFSKFLVE